MKERKIYNETYVSTNFEQKGLLNEHAATVNKEKK